MFKQVKRLSFHYLRKLISKKRYGVNTFDNECFEYSLIRPDLGKSYGPLTFKLLPIILTKLEEYHTCTGKYISPGTADFSEYKTETIRHECEHYILLPAIIEALKISHIVEIGTFKGASSFSILSNTTAKVESFDIIPYHAFSNSLIREEWVYNSRFKQHIADLSDSKIFKQYEDILSNSDLIFLDAPKDGKFEKAFLSNLFSSNSMHNVYVLIDDINVSTMVDLWCSIPYERLDLSFIGHWSGSGLVYIP